MGAISRALTMVFGAVLASVITMIFVARRLPSTRFGKALVLDTAIGVHGGNTIDWTGALGTTITALRPAGTAELDGRRVDVVSDGAFIDSGVKVKVVRVEGTRVVVTKVV
jgi:membrane-bound serine protease (ClpP class)